MNPRYRTASAVQIFWRDGILCLHHYLFRTTYTAIPFTVALLDFTLEWRSSDEVAAQYPEYSSASLQTALNDLASCGLLLIEGTELADQDAALSSAWQPWLPHASLHFSSKDSSYVTAESPDELKRSTLPTTPQPPHYKPAHGEDALHLERPAAAAGSSFLDTLLSRRTHRQFSDAPVTMHDITQLLALVWSVQSEIETSQFGKLALKTSPSGGARHPGEVYLMAMRVAGLEPGIYHYHPLHHTLSLVNPRAEPDQAIDYCAGQGFVGNAAALFLMTAVFERAMWKYHLPRAYRVVTLDTGHLAQTFCLVATWLGLAPFGTAALHDTKIEQDLGIDGIRESVLFVAGVGHRVEEN